MRNKRTNEVRTPQTDTKIGDRVLIKGEPHLLIKQGQKTELLSAPQLVKAIYGKPVNCIIDTEPDSG